MSFDTFASVPYRLSAQWSMTGGSEAGSGFMSALLTDPPDVFLRD